MFRTRYQATARINLVSGLRDVLFRATRKARARPRARKMTERDIDALAQRVILPSLPVSDEERARATHQDEGQRLARQDRWSDLSRRIRHADATRLTTPGGETASLLLAFGARCDAVAAAEDALHDGVAPDPAGVAALEEVLEEEAGDHACALVVALTHLDIAWAWHNTMFATEPEKSLTRAHRHLERAGQILGAHDGVALDAPSILAAQCALSATNDSRGHQLADDYTRLIGIDPGGPRHMRAMGRHLLPLLATNPTILEVGARRIAALTRDTWGTGGYAWVYLDALMADCKAVDLLDPDFFIEGMRDIIARQPDQHVVNQFAAFCAISMAAAGQDAPLSRPADRTRARLHACLDWVLAEHLQELHPLIWSQTLLAPGQVPMLPSRRALVVKGRQTALRIIATHFADQIVDGSSIAFSQHGMYRLPAL